MNVKVFPPFGLNANHKITQTYHSKPTQWAVDISGITGRKVYGHAGTVVYVRKDLGQKSYVAIDIGESELLFYVHINPLVEVGDKIEMGQVIATVHKKVQFATHLHFTFQRKDRKPSQMHIMDYVNRDTNWYATGPAIKALWCKKDGTIDWRKFGNRYVEIPGPVEDCEPIKQKLADTTLELVETQKELLKCQGDNKLLVERNSKLEQDILKVSKENLELESKIENLSQATAKCAVNLSKAREDLATCRAELGKLSTVNGLLSALLKKLVSWLEFVKKSE